MVSTLIVEDNRFVASFFEDILKENELFSHVELLRDSEHAVNYCTYNNVDLILMDVYTLHGHSGLKAAEKIKSIREKTKIIIVTSIVDPDILQKAVDAGVDGLWYKDHGDEEIINVILKVLEGNRVFPDNAPNKEIGEAWSNDISDMQKDILRLYILGNSYADIGKKLFVAERTVKYHMNQMIEKCGFTSKQQLIAAAIESRIISNLNDE